MDRRFLTVLGVSLVFALVVSSIFYQISARSGGSSGAGTETRDLVVAVKPLAVGAMVTPDDVKVVKVPAAQFPAGGVSNVEEVIDRPVISNILLDEPIHQGRLAPRGSGAGLAPVIPEGMRAVSLKVNEVVGVGGFVLPGMRVDVLVTGSPPTAQRSDMTATILQNILVLAAGTRMEADAQGRAINSRHVTLLVTPQQAELLTLAANQGQVQLVLRNGSDQTEVKTKGARETELFRISEPPKPAPQPVRVVARPQPPPPPPAPVKKLDQIEVFRGSKKTVQVVNSGS